MGFVQWFPAQSLYLGRFGVQQFCDDVIYYNDQNPYVNFLC